MEIKEANFKKLKAGIFIDASNIFYSEKRAGWRIDYEKLKNFISQEFDLRFTKYYVAIPKKNDQPAYDGKIKYLSHLEDVVEIISKPLKYIQEEIQIEDKKIHRIIKKGDVDIEIAVDVMNLQQDLDVIIILSGDSDYVALRDDVLKKGKRVLFIANRYNLSTELAQGKYLTLNKIRPWIELHKKNPPQQGDGILVSLLYKKGTKKSSEIVDKN